MDQRISDNLTRTELRKRLCTARSQLTVADQQAAGIALLNQFQRWFNHIVGQPKAPPQNIAAYLAVRGEISLTPVIGWLHEAGKSIYLPVIVDSTAPVPMVFAPWDPGTKLRRGKYNIDIPDVPVDNYRSAEAMDLTLAPLVGFDDRGGRLGMGGGYYDRTFSFRNTATGDGASDQSRLFVGVAHELQRVVNTCTDSWDIPLDTIITDKNIVIPE